MASITWILLCCILKATLLSVQGLDFTISRTPGSEVCATLRCSFDQDDDSGKAEIRKIILSDVSTSGSKFPLAYLGSSDKEVQVDPTKTQDIDGTGSIEKGHVELSVSLQNPTDCEFRSLQCEVEYVNAAGKKQVARKTINPQRESVRDDCSCASFKDQFSRLFNRADGTDLDLNGVRLYLYTLDEQTGVLANKSSALDEEIARLAHTYQVIDVSVTALQQASRDINEQVMEQRHNTSYIEASINDRQRSDEATKEDIAALKENDKNTDKLVAEGKRIDKVQGDVINALYQKDTVTKEELSDLRNTNQANEEEISRLQSTSTLLENTLNELNRTDAEAYRQIDALNDNDKNNQNSLDEFKSIVTVIGNDITNLVRTQRAIQTSVAQLEHTDTVIVEKITLLTESDARLTAELNRLDNRAVSINQDVQALKAANDEIYGATEDLIEEDAELQKRLDGLETEDEQLKAELEARRNEDSVQNQRITSLVVSVRATEDTLGRLIANQSALEADIEYLRSAQAATNALLDALGGKITSIKLSIEKAQVTTVTKTTTNLVTLECTSGLEGTEDKIPFMLEGKYPAQCDRVTDGGGWVVVLERFRGDVDFNRGWVDYKTGFGDVYNDFFVGLDVLYRLTQLDYTEARIDLTLDGKTYYAQYSEFRVSDEASNYQLTATGYSGNAGDAFKYHNGAAFSTYDRDNDKSNGNCAKNLKAAFWYVGCAQANLFGNWGRNDETGIIWKTLNEFKSVSRVELKLRRRTRRT